MFVHTVFFWMKDGMTPAEDARFEAGLAGLLTIPQVTGGWFGKPAGTPRDVVDNSYGYGLTVLFADAAGQDVYQDCQAHLDFIAACGRFWTRVQVYDFVSNA